MKYYELVTVIDANLSAKEMKEVRAKVESLVGEGIVETDDIGLLPTAYPLEGQDQAYYVSYHVKMDVESLEQLKSDMKIIKGLAKFTLFGMSENDAFLTMGSLKKRFEDMQPEEEVAEEVEEKEEE